MTRAKEQPPVLLTIAGFDPSSGAGITADLQVFTAHGGFGTACPTALTVQTSRGVKRVVAVEAELLGEMLRCVADDLPPAGIKIGMLANAGITRTVADFIRSESSHRSIPIVVDPVLRSSSGSILLETEAQAILVEELFSQALCVTPNRGELRVLLGVDAIEATDLYDASLVLMKRSGVPAIIVTGGDEDAPDDLLVIRGHEPRWLRGRRIETNSTHGTGCAFSSALLSRIVAGDDLFTAAHAAKRYVERSLLEAPGLGSGKGPMKLSETPYGISRIP